MFRILMIALSFSLISGVVNAAKDSPESTDAKPSVLAEKNLLKEELGSIEKEVKILDHLIAHHQDRLARYKNMSSLSKHTFIASAKTQLSHYKIKKDELEKKKEKIESKLKE